MTSERGNAAIGVVVLSHNKRDYLLQALESIGRSDYAALSIVVVDNASIDGSADAVSASFSRATLIRNLENQGAAGGRNTGWRHLRTSGCQYLVFLDDDAEVSPSYFAKIAECFETYPDVGIVAGKALTAFDSGVIMSAGINFNRYTGYVGDIGVGEKDTGQFEFARDLDACGGFALAVRASVFEELHGIDEAFNPYGWEEVDFCLRARKAGHRVFYEPRAVVSHKGSKAGRLPKAEYERHKVRNYFRLLGRHTNFAQKMSCVIFVPFKCAKVAWTMLRTGNAKIIAAQARGFLDGMRGLSG